MKLLKNIAGWDCKTSTRKNKGAISLEYILIIVVVVLVALGAMRIFGSQVGTTINDSANAVDTTTTSVFNQLDGSGSGSGGGSTPSTPSENVGPLYLFVSPRLGDRSVVWSESTKQQAINDDPSNWNETNFVEYTGDVYTYTFPSTIMSKAPYYTNGTERTAVLFQDMTNNSRTISSVSLSTETLWDSGKTPGEINVGDTISAMGTTFEVKEKATATGVLNATSEKFYKPVVLDLRLQTPENKNSSINHGMQEEDFVLYSGRAYKVVLENNGLPVSPQTHYLTTDRVYVVASANSSQWFTEDKSSEFPVGGDYHGETIIISEWKDGVEVLHE